MTQTRTKALEEILVSMFDANELRQFIDHFSPDTHSAVRSDVPKSIFAHEAVRALERRGLISDRFFDELRAARPERAVDIAKLRALKAPIHRRQNLVLAAVTITLGLLGLTGVLHYQHYETLPQTNGASFGRDLIQPHCPPNMIRISSSDTTRSPLAPFCLDVHEVTRADLGLRCPMAIDDHAPAAVREHAALLCHPLHDDATWGAHPAANISPAEARHFCESRGRRLPTRREWYVAAEVDMGGRQIDALTDRMNLCDASCFANTSPSRRPSSHFLHNDRFPRSSPVATYFNTFPSALGLHDMFGNIREIVQDGELFTSCGSSWKSWAPDQLLPSNCIHPDNPATPDLDRDEDLGFRCALDLHVAP